MSSPMIDVTGVTQRFGTTTALDDVSLTVSAGEFVTLIGPSGCGKSTLLRLVADLLTPTAGTVQVAGKTARAAREAQDYGIAFQQAGLLEWRSVVRNVELPLELHGVGARERRARAEELLEVVGLADVAGKRPSQLSGGMQQRVAIARALAPKPALLLMDEPFGALDEMTRERLQDELLAIRAREGTTVLLVTHSVSEAAYLSDRVVVMSPRPGRIAAVVDVDLPVRATGTPTDVRESPEFFAATTVVREALRGRKTEVAGS